MVHPYHEILLSNEEETTTDTHDNLDESPENYADWKKPIPKGYIVCDSTYITLMKWQDCRNEKQISGCQGL